MIRKINYLELNCDSCIIEAIQVKTHEEARKKKWAISRDRKHCYCPNCAPYFRNSGKQTTRIIWEMRKNNEI